MIIRLMGTWIVASAVVLLAGCSNSEMMNTWKSPDAVGAPFKKVLVVGVAKRPEVRKMYEDDFVKQLKAAGVEGVSSYGLIPDIAKATRDDVKRAAGKSGADAVLVTRLVKFDKQTYTPPTNVRAEIYLGTNDEFTPSSESVTTVTVILENQLYQTAGEHKAWSGTTKSFDPNDNLARSISDLSALIVKTLTAQKLI